MENHGESSRRLIVVLDDDVNFCRTARLLLGTEFEVETLVDSESLYRFLKHEEPDLLLLDVKLEPEGPEERTGFDVYEELLRQGHQIPVIILTVLAGMDVTRRALQYGLPFLQKDASLSPDLFQQTVRQALETQRLRLELDYRRRSMQVAPETLPCPWPDSPAGRKVLDALEPFVGRPTPLLLEGERGSGRRTTAAWVHSRYPGPATPFIRTSAFESDDMETVLFGSASGADKASVGLFQSAAGGTVYIEEFDQLPPVSILRISEAVRSRSYSPHGSARRYRLNCRVIVACQGPWNPGMTGVSSLEAFWKPFRVRIPPLREHREDLLLHLEYLAWQLDSENMPHQPPSKSLVAQLQDRKLAGNFNDLRTVLILGIDALAGPERVSRAASLDDARIVGMSKMQFDYYALMIYLRTLDRALGKNVNAWIARTGASRATVYRWRDLLDGDTER